MSVPPVLTRLGYRLFLLGFTWFKDWYFSSRGHEGGQKLQGEKPLDDSARRRHLDRIKSEAELFLQSTHDPGDDLKYYSFGAQKGE
jgi:hypothetical protein